MRKSVRNDVYVCLFVFFQSAVFVVCVVFTVEKNTGEVVCCEGRAPKANSNVLWIYTHIYIGFIYISH